MSERKNSAAPIRPAAGGPRGRAKGPRQPIHKETVLRLLSYLKPFWPRLLLVLVCVVLNAIATAAAATFLGRMIDGYITPMLASSAPDFSGLISAILRMAALYALAIAATFAQARVMAVVSCAKSATRWSPICRPCRSGISTPIPTARS